MGDTFCWDDIAPKRGKAELEPMGACHKRERERETPPQQVEMPRQTNGQKVSVSVTGEPTDGTVMSASTPRPDKNGWRVE